MSVVTAKHLLIAFDDGMLLDLGWSRPAWRIERSVPKVFEVVHAGEARAQRNVPLGKEAA